ncbi:MAG TPA: iron-sulfur cluster assembly accessory protein [Myxococcales bacterium]|nr:iron-sulfur cluster assembly accessory protein [Myxococcales bacterium]
MALPLPETAPAPAFSLSEKAAQKIAEAVRARPESTEKTGLRVGIRGGGCSGLSYVFEFCDEPREKDTLFELAGARVYIDPKSLLFLKGTRLDWQETLMGRGFKLENPAVKQACGCGTSFTV